jgi:hypothetical protein
MSKPATFVLAIAALVLAVVIVAVLVLRQGSGGGGADLTAAQPAAPTPEREPIVAPTSPPPGTRIASAPPRHPPAPPPVQEPRPRAATGEDAGARLDEASLLSRLHDLAASDPPRSLELAREAIARFPDGANAPEFEWNVVKALANMDRYGEAEEEARSMLRRFPGSAFSEDVEHHLLNHPPNPPSAPAP